MAGTSEFDLIARLFRPIAGGRPEALGLADDVALIAGPDGQDWAVTTDMVVAGVHFFPDDPPDLIARKLLRVNLSDLAAKSAKPRFLLMNCSFPVGVDAGWLDRFAAGLMSDCQAFEVALIGGDTVVSPGPLTLALTAIGSLPKGSALLRSTARSGDTLWVSGSLGDAALGLLVAKGEATALAPSVADYLLQRYRLPQPRLALGYALRGLAHAAMDISDGLMGDLEHLCAASHLAATLFLAAMPLSPAARTALDAGIGDLTAVINGGDDYEVLFAAPAGGAGALGDLSQRLALPLTAIGSLRSGEGVHLVDAGGRAVTVGRRGYDHFAGPAG